MTTVNKPKHNLDANLLDNLVSVNGTEQLSLVHLSGRYDKYLSYGGSCLTIMLRVVLVHMSSRLSLDFVKLNLVSRPLLDEDIWVRDFVMLRLGPIVLISLSQTCSLSIFLSCIRVVVSTYLSCTYQQSVNCPQCGWQDSARVNVLSFFLHTKANVWLFSIN